jgi:hypothetical protein
VRWGVTLKRCEAIIIGKERSLSKKRDGDGVGDVLRVVSGVVSF